MSNPLKDTEHDLTRFLHGRSAHTLALFHRFLEVFREEGAITVHPAKTMIGIADGHRRIVWITRLGKDHIRVVFPFPEPHEQNFCFEKIAQVPGDRRQFNHHLRICSTEDINDEVRHFMRLALSGGDLA
jgi:hypothetical protein